MWCLLLWFHEILNNAVLWLWVLIAIAAILNTLQTFLNLQYAEKYNVFIYVHAVNVRQQMQYTTCNQRLYMLQLISFIRRVSSLYKKDLLLWFVDYSFLQIKVSINFMFVHNICQFELSAGQNIRKATMSNLLFINKQSK